MIYHGYVVAIDGGHIRTFVINAGDSLKTPLMDLLRDKMLPIMGTEGDDWELGRIEGFTNGFNTLLVRETTETFKGG